MKLVSKLNRGVVNVSTEYGNRLLKEKGSWAKEADFLKDDAPAETETSGTEGA